jgi:hypothetical protein
VRAEAHPIYCGYFKMQALGGVSRDRLHAIAAAKGLEPSVLDKPDEMLPLSPTHSSNKVRFAANGCIAHRQADVETPRARATAQYLCS